MVFGEAPVSSGVRSLLLAALDLTRSVVTGAVTRGGKLNREVVRK
jgi:hypothetical protein